MTTNTRKQTPLYHFLAPRYWLIWIGLALLRLLIMLPFPVLVRLGAIWGAVIGLLFTGRRKVAERNLELCFPEMDGEQREELLRDVFKSLGFTFFELGLAWWSSDKKLMPLTDISGLHHLENALDSGNGVLLLSAHFSSLDLAARLLHLYAPLDLTYRFIPNPLINEIMRRGRFRCADQVIAKENMRAVLKSVKSGGTVWFLPDQAHRGTNSSIAPFFGISASTNTTPSRISSFCHCSVVPYLALRKPDNSGYSLEIFPALHDFPAADAQKDAEKINNIFESWIRRAPGQYVWIHKRFKSDQNLYAG